MHMSERDYLISKAERAVEDRYRRGETLMVRRGGELKARATDPGYAAGIGGSIGGAVLAHRGLQAYQRADNEAYRAGRAAPKLLKTKGGKMAAGGAALAAGSSLAGGLSMHRAGNRWREKKGLPQRSYWGGFKVEQ